MPNLKLSKHKARLFKKTLGMTRENTEELREVLLQAVKTGDAQLGRRDEYGQTLHGIFRL